MRSFSRRLTTFNVNIHDGVFFHRFNTRETLMNNHVMTKLFKVHFYCKYWKTLYLLLNYWIICFLAATQFTRKPHTKWWRKIRHKIRSELTNGEWSTAKLWQRTHQFTIEHFMFLCYQLLNQICICNVCCIGFVSFAAGVELWNIQLRFNFNCVWIFMTNHCIIIRIAFMVYFNQVKISGECTWVHNLAARCARIRFVSIKF